MLGWGGRKLWKSEVGREMKAETLRRGFPCAGRPDGPAAMNMYIPMYDTLYHTAGTALILPV